MDNNLIFHETLTIEQFKTFQHVDKLQVKQNPKGGKLFMTYGGKTAAVAAAGIPVTPMVSLVTPEGQEPCFDERRIGSDKTCPTFWLLHEEGNGGKEMVVHQWWPPSKEKGALHPFFPFFWL